MATQHRDQRVRSPLAAVRELKKRTEAAGGEIFFAPSLAHLSWLADRLVDAEKAGGRELRDFVREFGLQLRATDRALTEFESQAPPEEDTSPAEWRTRLRVVGEQV